MNCPDFDTLMMLLDGELEEEKLKEVSEHLMLCSRCRYLIDSQRNLETSWRDSFVTPEDDKFRSMECSIFNRINRRSRWKIFVPAAAAIIAVLLGVKLILDKPFPGRVTELSRGGRAEYPVDNVQFGDVPEESLTSDIDGIDSENDVSTGDVTAEITGKTEGYSLADVEPAQPQSSAGENSAEEHEEIEIPEEIISMGAVEGSSLEEQMDDISDIITLSLDADTTGLGTAGTMPSFTSTSEETEDNRALNQSGEYYSRLHETSGCGMNASGADIYIELVFDAAGQPDSSTALLLDSLFAGWSDYIPFVYRDTVLVVPLADVQELFMESTAVPAETIE
ncbi:MAG: hypothetical protein GQ565_03570 [Candidatus Aegiribacteria sp.]|nr:hypothetical protein [Candidatus Aegiribacteria sp.]